MMMTSTSHSPAETLTLAMQFARTLRPGDTVALQGDLGSGKTMFARGVAQACGVKTPISSPTYTIQHTYKTPHGILHHIDLYRLTTPDDIDLLDLDACWEDGRAITLIEWPERAGNLLPPRTWHVTIHAGTLPEERQIEIIPPPPPSIPGSLEPR